MEKKTKFIIGGLLIFLIISLFINLQTYTAKQALEREREDLKRENISLVQKVETSLKDSRRLDDRINALNSDLNRLTKEKEELQKKFELVSKERQELIDKLKVRQRPVIVTEPQKPAATEDTYWAGVLKAKTDLEIQLENIRQELKLTQIDNEQLKREKSSSELEVNNLNREQQDLRGQLEYNQKLMDTLSQELVKEKNDKFQITENIQLIKNENEILRRQLKSINKRKTDLDRKFTDLQKENVKLSARVKEVETSLQGKSLQIDSLKKQLATGQPAKEIPGEEAGSVELPPIVVRPQVSKLPPAVTATASLIGKVLAVNKENNFVIIDSGEEQGIKVGDTFQVYRDGSAIADLEVIQTRKQISACDIKKETTSIKVGDTVK